MSPAAFRKRNLGGRVWVGRVHIHDREGSCCTRCVPGAIGFDVRHTVADHKTKNKNGSWKRQNLQATVVLWDLFVSVWSSYRDYPKIPPKPRR